MERRLAARLPMQLFVVDVRTGQTRTILRSTDWLNHLQFSPTDPALLLFCHEGPWHKVDRTWTIRSDGTGLTQIHRRTMNMEIEGHEFFSGDGRHIWYDLQTPRSEVFWLAGYELATGRRTWYHLERAEWSVHFNVSPDGTLFAGDGGGPSSVAAPGNGQWIYLFRPQLVRDRTDNALPNSQRSHPARRAEGGEAGQSRQARLQPRAKRHVHAGHAMDRLPLEHVRTDSRVRGRGEQAMKILACALASIVCVSCTVTTRELAIADASGVVVRVDTPMAPPRWATLERQLLAANVPACREFYDKYFESAGTCSVSCAGARTTDRTTRSRTSITGRSCTPWARAMTCCRCSQGPRRADRAIHRGEDD